MRHDGRANVTSMPGCVAQPERGEAQLAPTTGNSWGAGRQGGCRRSWPHVEPRPPTNAYPASYGADRAITSATGISAIQPVARPMCVGVDECRERGQRRESDLAVLQTDHGIRRGIGDCLYDEMLHALPRQARVAWIRSNGDGSRPAGCGRGLPLRTSNKPSPSRRKGP